MGVLYRIAISKGNNKIGFAYRSYKDFKDNLNEILDSVEGFGDGDTEIKLSTREESENE